MYGRILKSLNIVNLYRGISKLKLEINEKVPQLLCIVVSVALNFEFAETCLLQFDQFNPVKVSYVNAFQIRVVYFVFAKGIPGLSLTEERLGGNILYSFFP